MKKLMLSFVAGMMLLCLPMAASAEGTDFSSNARMFTFRYGVVGADGRLRYSTVRLMHKPTATDNAVFNFGLTGASITETVWYGSVNFTRADSPAAGVIPPGAMGRRYGYG